MKLHKLCLLLFAISSQLVAEPVRDDGSHFCRNHYDCASHEWCEAGSCRSTAAPGPAPAPSDSGWLCRNDWDCSLGQSCLAGTCTTTSSGSSSGPSSSDGGSTPIYGG